MAKTDKKILLVDDNDDCREMLALFIKRLGYQVLEAGTGVHAVDRASSTRPDLIMMDLCLPVMNGDEATACLKANVYTRDIPVLINGASSISDVHKKRLLATGASEILQKPLNLSKLPTILTRYLAR
jgi:CheY-like chemotaxis protein